MKFIKAAKQTQTEASETIYVVKRGKVYMIDQGQLWELPVIKLKDVPSEKTI